MTVFILFNATTNRVLEVLITKIDAEKARLNYLTKTLTNDYIAIIEKTIKWSVKNVFETQN